MKFSSRAGFVVLVLAATAVTALGTTAPDDAKDAIQSEKAIVPLQAAPAARGAFERRPGALLIKIGRVPIELISDADASADDDRADDSVSSRRRIADASFDRLVFGDGLSAKDFWPQGRSLLREKIAAVDGICGLTDMQKRKLDLAGRGDLQRLLNRVEAVRKILQSRYITDGSLVEMRDLATELARETSPLRASLQSNPFEDGSLFDKTLEKALTCDQSVRYDERRPNSHGTLHLQSVLREMNAPK